MSKSINVNPDHYKVAGRERQGDAVIQNLERQQFAEQQADAERWRAQHEGPQPWEATAAPSVKDAQADVRGRRKSRRPGGATTRRSKAGKVRLVGRKRRKTPRGKTSAATRRRPAARRSKAAKPSQRKRRRPGRRG
jgi:hypothetical protein